MLGSTAALAQTADALRASDAVSSRWPQETMPPRATAEPSAGAPARQTPRPSASQRRQPAAPEHVNLDDVEQLAPKAEEPMPRRGAGRGKRAAEPKPVAPTRAADAAEARPASPKQRARAIQAESKRAARAERERRASDHVRATAHRAKPAATPRVARTQHAASTPRRTSAAPTTASARPLSLNPTLYRGKPRKNVVTRTRSTARG
jgi:hypothetical protein